MGVWRKTVEEHAMPGASSILSHFFSVTMAFAPVRAGPIVRLFWSPDSAMVGCWTLDSRQVHLWRGSI